MCSGGSDRLAMPGLGEICVRQFSLKRAACEPPSLTEAEFRVADGMHGRARARYVVGRTLLRRWLGRLLGCDPLSVTIIAGPDGKPAVAKPVLSFNVSHAGDIVLIAVSRPRRLGVDVEQIRPGLDIRMVIEEMLDTADREVLSRVVEREGREAFFRYWTRYEAAVKARGDGLRLPLAGLTQVASTFEIRDLELPPGYVGAVAADGPWETVICE